MMQKALEHLIGGHDVVEAHGGHGVHNAGVLGVKRDDVLGPRDFFAKEDAIADLGLIACPGAEELCKLVDSHLVRWAREVGNTDVDTFIIPSDCPRFQSGDAKGLVKASTRGDDLYIFVDPGNYSVTYQFSDMRTISPRTTTSRT